MSLPIQRGELIRPIMILGVGIVLIGGLALFRVSKKRTLPVLAASQASAATGEAEPAYLPPESLFEKQAAQKAKAKQPWARNPFSETDFLPDARRESDGVKTDDRTMLALTGIMTRGDKRVAIINHLFVQEGDSIQGAKVLRIEDDRVLLKRDNQEINLRIHSA